MSLDGRIAAAPGARTALTSAAANRHAQRLRAEVDAIAVGADTVLIDDPLLTARDVYRWRPLTRVVFDNRLRTPPTSRIFTTLDDGPMSSSPRSRRAGEIVRVDQPSARARRRGRDDRRDGDGARSERRDDAVCSRITASARCCSKAARRCRPPAGRRASSIACELVTPHALGPEAVRWDVPAWFDGRCCTIRGVNRSGDDVLMEADVLRD